MRKISKSRVDDDVVSSTNGSLLNDDRAGSPNNDVNEKDADPGSDDDGTRANTEENEESDADNNKEPPKKKGRGRPRKGGKENSEKFDGSDDDTNGNSDTDEDDNDTSADYGSKKKTPKKATPKSKAKKRKTGKEKAVEEEYEVEKIVDSKKIKGKLHYLIRWKGYSADSDTWEPHNTLSCPDLISKYNDEKENGKGKSKEDKKPKAMTSTKRKGKRDVSAKPSKRPKTEWDSEAADENAEYEVERILEVHHKKTGKREFLIHWKGWSNKFDSWEPEENLNCSELINKFMSKVSAAKTSDSRNLRVAPESTNRFTLQAPTTGRRLSKRRGQRQRVRYDNAE